MEKSTKFEIKKDARFTTIEKLLFNILLTLEDINNNKNNLKQVSNKNNKKIVKKEVI